jgi:hypothetical protein
MLAVTAGNTRSSGQCFLNLDFPQTNPIFDMFPTANADILKHSYYRVQSKLIKILIKNLIKNLILRGNQDCLQPNKK